MIENNIIPPLVHLLATAEFDIRKESAWAISNATSGGSHDQIKYLVRAGCIKPLCDLLDCSDVRIITVALEGLENILKVSYLLLELNSTLKESPAMHFKSHAGGISLWHACKAASAL